MATITVTQEGARWIARFAWSVEVKDLVKQAGFRFDPARKLWWTDDPQIAAKLADLGGFADGVNNAVQAAAQAREASIAASRASASDFQIPLSAAVQARGMDFFPYQKAGVEYALARAATLIADEMGLGKTMQAVGVINADPSIRNILVICPASLKLNWQREAALWLSRDIPVALANGHFPGGGMVITNYEMVAKQRAAIDAIDWDLLVCDESHYVKNDKAARTRSILGRGDRDPAKRVAPIRARRRLFLTGTPILNRPIELWTLIHALDPQGLGRNWKSFVTRYCAAFQHRPSRFAPLVWDTTGASNLAELQSKLRASVMVRRLKADVLTELPPIRRQIVPLQPLTKRSRDAVENEARVTAAHEARLAQLREAVEALDPETAQDAYEAAARALREAQGVAFEETSAVRHEVALAKLPMVADHLIDLLEGSDQKLVVFAHHHDVIDELKDRLGQVIGPLGLQIRKCDGRDNIGNRDAAVQAFQNDPSVRVILCGLMAMGVGHTLTAASHVVFCEADWTPGNLAQGEARCHRIGQHDSVLAQHLVLDGSMDARMTEMVVGKMGVIADALDTLPAPTMPAPPRPEAADARKPVSAPEVAPEVKAAVAASLRVLAGVCDGAVKRDDAGFNGRDAAFGHDLASRPALSDKQALAALRMLRKYRRQIPADAYAVMFPAADGNEA